MSVRLPPEERKLVDTLRSLLAEASGDPPNGEFFFYHVAAPRHGRPNMHQQNHQPRHHQQPIPPQQQQPQASQQAPQQGQQYSPYSYYAPVAAVMPAPQMARPNMSPQYTLSPNAQEFVPSSFMTMRDPSQYMALQSGMLLVEPQAQMYPQPLQHQQQQQQPPQHQHQAQYHNDAAASHVTEAYEDPYQYYSKSYDEEVSC